MADSESTPQESEVAPGRRGFFSGHWTRNAVMLSVPVHLLFIAFAAAYVAIRVMHKPDSVLIAEAAPRPALEIKKLEMAVKVADLQKNSARPRLQPRMVTQSASEIALPEIKKIPRPEQRPVKRDFSTVGVSGFGAGVGGGLGTGTGGGSGDINFFGLKGSGEKVCLILDVSESMCEDERGGLRGYQNVKANVAGVIDKMRDGALFNVIVFEDGVSRCWDQLEPVTPENRKRADGWIDGFNRVQGPYGLANANYSPPAYGLEGKGGSSRLDLALTAAFEQGADTIFVITDGAPKIVKSISEAKYVEGAGHKVTEEDIKEWERRMERWEKQMKEWNKEQAKRERKGLGPSLTEGKRSGPPSKPRKPTDSQAGRRKVGGGQETYWTLDDVLAHIALLQKTLYLDKGRMEAIVHVVAYEAESDTKKFLRKVARENQGQYKSIRGM